VLAIALLAARLFGYEVGALCAVLSAFSLLLILLGASFMSHTTAIMFAAAAAAIHVHPKAQRLRWAQLAVGFFASLALITRPQDAFIILGPAALTAVFRGILKVTRNALSVAWIAAGAAGPLLFLLLWNLTLYGRVFASGYNLGASSPDSLNPIIADTFGLSNSFPLRTAVRQFIWTFARFNRVLFGWPCSLFFIPFAVAIRPRRPVLGLLVIFLATLTLYFFFPYYGFEYEARYYAPAALAAVILSAAGIHAGIGLITTFYSRRLPPEAARASAHALTAGILVAFFLYSLTYYWPAYLAPRYRNDYESVSRRPHEICSASISGEALVLLPAVGDDHFRYGSGLVYTDPFLRSRIIYARDLLPDEQCVLDEFPRRAIYRFVPTHSWDSGYLVKLRDRIDPADGSRQNRTDEPSESRSLEPHGKEEISRKERKVREAQTSEVGGR